MIDFSHLNAEYETLSQYNKQSMDTVTNILNILYLDHQFIELFQNYSLLQRNFLF